ncbi:IclR family transcriptional regulator [Gluconacetobacter sacchari]|uniref:IclR family transcriptional regulator n=2 Tax=Gluconacetobacter sacchari TaxID=92759 RepID=A0A7W4IG70_9PROT|nr:IclR family transcriptional regulator [Gluconacetobacter sacchari]MBB2162250.1 IclR family transcriptional regulator [Gluconacetobacter sacchari]GBQ22489.1 IclR family transcriptional regulator [Gluconacetobacter sacchari DSM 12717]
MSESDDDAKDEGNGYVSPPVQRAARLLRYIGDGGSLANVKAAAAALGISRTTLLRLLHTLEMERFIERARDGEYQIGIGLVGLVGESAFGQGLVRIALPIVANLAEKSGLSAHLGVLDGREAVYLARRVPNVPLASNISVGSRVGAHATTLGRAILAWLDPEDVRALYENCPLGQYTDRTPASWKTLSETLKRERETGYSESDGLYSDGVSSIAAPVFDESGRPIASVNVSGPTPLFETEGGRRAYIADLVTDAARQISVRLGWRATVMTHTRTAS